MSDNGMLIDPNLGMTESEKKKHDHELYGKARIDRHESKGTAQAHANEVLTDIGRFIQHDTSEKTLLKGMTYIGSAAVHVYYSELLKQAFFISQTATLSGRATEIMASDAFSDLRKQLMKDYGRRPEQKRSGF